MKKHLAILPSASQEGDVYSLVQGLSAGEKVVIRKTWHKNSGKKPLHAQFFEEIASGRAIDDANAQAVLRIKSSAQFSNLKQHLIGEVLDTLVGASRQQSPQRQLYFGLMQLQLLTERGLNGLARRLCKRLLAAAEDAGQYNTIVELLHYRSKLIEQRTLRQYRAEFDEISVLMERGVAYQQTAQQILWQTQRLLVLRASDQLLVSEDYRLTTQHIMEDLSALDISAKVTPHLRFCQLTALAIGHHMMQQLDDCTTMCEEGMMLLERRPEIIQAREESFLSFCNIAFYNEFATSRISHVIDWLRRFDHLLKGRQMSSHFQRRWNIIRFNTALKIAHKTADYDSVARIIDNESAAIMNEVALVISPAESLSIWTSVAISLFVLERFSEAEALMQEIKEKNRSLERQDVFYFTLVFHLLILYELKEWFRLDAATAAAYHVLYNHKKLRPFEKELMSFLKALPVRRGRGDNVAFIKAFVERLEVYRTDPVQRLYFLYFNYSDWLQSKLAGISYREYKKRLLSNALEPA